MESNSSRNSRDYWGNQQVRANVQKKYLQKFNDLHDLFHSLDRRRVQHQVEKIKLHRQVTQDEVHRLRKIRVVRKAFLRISATLSGQMEAQRQPKCKQMQCLRVVERLFLQCHVQAN